MFEIIEVSDIIKVIADGKDTGFYLVKSIEPDTGNYLPWWHVTLELINHPLELTWILNENQLAGEEFTMKGQPLQLVLFSRKAKEQSAPAGYGTAIPLAEIKSLF